MTRITITKARGGFIVEGTEESDPSIAIHLSDTLAAAASALTHAEYSSSVIGDVIILTPTGRPAHERAKDA